MEPSHAELDSLHAVLKRFYLLILVASVAVLGGCRQKVFVGLPTPEPDTIVQRPDGPVPVPPFGPHSYPPMVPVPEGPPPSDLVAAEPTGPAFVWSETENYLILGTDRRPVDETWRTDTIMVVGLDRPRQRAAVLSIPRDLYLEIPNYGYGRINQVDYIGERITRVEGGGPGLVSAVISQTLGISTTHWVRFEMTGFKDIVDAVGGVTVQLDCPFYEPILNLDTNSWEYFTLPAGPVHLDGETAYWFVRLRLRESDIGRAERQRQFLWGLRDQVLSTNLLPQIPALWTAFDSSISTDLTLLQIMDLARFGVGLDAANVRASGITLRELQSYTTERGAAVLVINDPQRVRDVIEGIWTAPAMADAYRKDVNTCAPVPDGAPVIASAGSPAPAPTPLPTEVPILVPTPVVAEGAAVAPEPIPASGGGG